MKNKKKNGFSLVELLTTVVVIGIIFAIATVAYSKYIDKAKEEKDKQNETLIVETAKSYLESNPTKKPKSIGESLKIDLYTLRKNNYLKEDVKNSKNESCMTNSYVYVYKNDYDKYSYKGILYCGDEKVKPEKDIPRPTITDFVFADKEDISKASFSMTIHGSDDDSVGIESYNYLIEVYKNKSKDQTEVYNSGSLSGRNQKTITVNNILISDYIKRTDYTEVKIIVLVRNTLGGVYELTKSAEFEDTLKPICGSVINEAKEDEWYNKKDVLKDNKKRQITVNCSDGNGSGCLRNTFSKTWPGNPVQSVEYSTIEIKDNKGIKNNCRVRVNIDVVAPTIKVTAYDGKNNVATTKTATDGETKTIEKNSYKGNHDGWLNGTNYPDGVKYKVEVSDETRLNRYTWETSAGDSSSGYIVDKEDNPTKSSVFYIYLKDQGKRSGKLTVYDIAGNKTEMIINAYIDYTNPTCTNDVTCTGGGDCSRWLGISKSLTIKTICNDEGGSNCLPNTGGSFKYNDNIDIRNGGPGGAGKTVDVYDAAGNKGTCPANVTVRIDHINPTCTNVVTCTSGNKCNDWLGIGKFVKITAKCDDDGGSKCASSEEISHTYKDENINITNAGPAGRGKDVIVYDNAGNKGTCFANKTVKIDIEAPSAPKINLYKWSNNKTKPTSTSGLGSYTAGTWSNKKVYTKPSGSKDNYEFSHYEYKTEGKTTNQTNIQATYRNIEANGESKIYYRACDKANNCSEYSAASAVVKVDTLSPIVSCKIESKKISEVSVNDSKLNDAGHEVNCTDNKLCSGIKSTSYVITTASSAPTAGSTTWENSIPATKNACGKKYYGYVKGVDNAGNSEIVKCGNYSNDACCSEDNPFGCEIYGPCRKDGNHNGSTATFNCPKSNMDMCERINGKRDAYWTGTLMHTAKDKFDKVYRLKKDGHLISDGPWIKVCVQVSYGTLYMGESYSWLDDYWKNNTVTKNGQTCYKVWIHRNCINPSAKTCSSDQCPG